MTELHITWVDIAVAAILILSTVLAVFRGFVRETLSIFAWAAAAFAMLYFGHYAVPLLAPHMSLILAEVLGYTATFLLVLMPLLFIGSRFSRRVYDSPVGGLDRVLGALFGLVRGLVAIAVLYILYSIVVPVSAQAKWMKSAHTLPLIQKSASFLLALLPDEDAKFVETRTQRGTAAKADDASQNSPDGEKAAYTAAKPPASPAHDASVHRKVLHKGYGAEDRRALNRLIQTSGSGGNE